MPGAGTDHTQARLQGGPAIILVEPQLAENIGMCARAMANFGLSELRLVAPRDGCCNTGVDDVGSHTVCVVATAGFLEFSKSRGNDLSTPLPAYGFAGLKPGDRWCLCAPRWQEAFEAGQAPRVVLRATHEGALSYCSLADLKRFAIDLA